ncbi:MAG TPA: carboxypeptidase regulatory-like domain-containing protein [Chthoniobacterales bacterium]|nr:carboxypeptidase regulatory-like domain-containing protein [Chthoniobacterales bacterium]
MKRMIRGILLFFVLSAMSIVYAEAPKGVAGVSIVVKQTPTKRTVTDSRGNFSLEGLPAGSYTLTIRPQKANDTKTASTTKAIVATSYSIKVEGVKRPITQSGLTSDKLLAGVDVPVEVGAGAKVRGQVLAGGLKKMVWIAPEVGSHFPGHWVDADSKEAAAHNSARVSGDDFRNNLQMAPDPHQEGFKGADDSKLSGINSPGR